LQKLGRKEKFFIKPTGTQLFSLLKIYSVCKQKG